MKGGYVYNVHSHSNSKQIGSINLNIKILRLLQIEWSKSNESQFSRCASDHPIQMVDFFPTRKNIHIVENDTEQKLYFSHEKYIDCTTMYLYMSIPLSFLPCTMVCYLTSTMQRRFSTS